MGDNKSGDISIIAKKESVKIKRIAARYNMFVNLFWSALNLLPVSIFCYDWLGRRSVLVFLLISLLPVFLPRSFFNKIQLGATTLIYERLGVNYFNRFIQNGSTINRIMRKKYPGYKVVSTTRSSIKGLLNQTYIFEKFHSMLLLFFMFTTIAALAGQHYLWALVLLITNTVYNVYPNLLQQYIRIRLISIMKRA